MTKIGGRFAELERVMYCLCGYKYGSDNSIGGCCYCCGYNGICKVLFALIVDVVDNDLVIYRLRFKEN